MLDEKLTKFVENFTKSYLFWYYSKFFAIIYIENSCKLNALLMS